MTSQPDKLFRDKLENFQRPAPAGAWDKIETNLSKSHRKIIWIRAAAAIVLLATAAILLWPAEKEEQAISKTYNQKPIEKKNGITQPVVKEEAQERRQVTGSKRESHTAEVKKSEKPVKKDVQEVQNENIMPEVKQPETQELVAEVVPAPVKGEGSTTLVYTAQEVNAKFLKKKLSPEATLENKDASGIQKLIGLAFAAKNSEAGLGDLRQKKDDLFALGFNKKKGEN